LELQFFLAPSCTPREILTIQKLVKQEKLLKIITTFFILK